MNMNGKKAVIVAALCGFLGGRMVFPQPVSIRIDVAI